MNGWWITVLGCNIDLLQSRLEFARIILRASGICSLKGACHGYLDGFVLDRTDRHRYLPSGIRCVILGDQQDTKQVVER